MKIIKTSGKKHRYAKVLSSEMEGMIGRLYLEIEDRKKLQKASEEAIAKNTSDVKFLGKAVRMINAQNEKTNNILGQMFPDGENVAVIEKPLNVSGKVKSDNIELTTTTLPPIKVTSQELVLNLNVEMLGGNTLAQVESTMDTKISTYAEEVNQKLVAMGEDNKLKYTPISHVNSGGAGVHKYATTIDAGFMSPTDKLEHDDVVKRTKGLLIPGGMIVSEDEPTSPIHKQVWVDISEFKKEEPAPDPVPEPEVPGEVI